MSVKWSTPPRPRPRSRPRSRSRSRSRSCSRDRSQSRFNSAPSNAVKRHLSIPPIIVVEGITYHIADQNLISHTELVALIDDHLAGMNAQFESQTADRIVQLEKQNESLEKRNEQFEKHIDQLKKNEHLINANITQFKSRTTKDFCYLLDRIEQQNSERIAQEVVWNQCIEELADTLFDQLGEFQCIEECLNQIQELQEAFELLKRQTAPHEIHIEERLTHHEDRIEERFDTPFVLDGTTSTTDTPFVLDGTTSTTSSDHEHQMSVSLGVIELEPTPDPAEPFSA